MRLRRTPATPRSRTLASNLAATLALAALAAASAPARARAFETLAQPWRDGLATFRVNPSFPDQPLTGDPSMQVNILRSAAAAWRNQSGANFEFVYDGTTTRQGVALNDGVNTVSFVDDSGEEALAATFIRFGQGGRVASFDMVFYARTNGSTNRWNGPGDPTGTSIDLGGVAVHEFGHALGLDHTPIESATMFSSIVDRGVHFRTLADDDVAGVEFLYGGNRPGADPGPAILSVTPDFGSTRGGERVVIAGRNFGWTANATLRVDGVPLSAFTWEVETLDRVRIDAMPPHASGPVSISIANSLGIVELPQAYHYGGGPSPEILSIEPQVGPAAGGIEVTILGSNFLAGAQVAIGGVALKEVRVIDANTLVGVLPASSVSGPVDVRLSQEGAIDVLPGAFTYTPLVIEVDRVDVPRGASGEAIDVRASSDEDLSAISLGLLYDAANVTLREISVDGTAASAAAFAAANIDPDGGVATFGVVMDFFDATPSIPAGERVLVARLIVDVADAATVGAVLPLDIAGDVGQPPIELFFTKAGTSAKLAPFAIHGSIRVTAGAEFIRGDADGNGELDLSDVVRFLDYLYRGAAPVACTDAADANDDGRMDISDAIYSLLYLFSGGQTPRAPFPLPGIDPTDDVLRCL